MFFTILWIIGLHAIGAITFFNMVDGFGGDEVKKPLNNLPPYLRIFVLLLWPYIMLYWLIAGKHI